MTQRLPGHYSAREAIEGAIEALETAHCVEGPPPEIAACIETLQMILAQKGCEHFDKAGDGTLTDLIDIIVFG